MIKPTKHQSLDDNVLVIGADIMHALRKDSLTIEALFQIIKKEHNIRIDILFDSLTFLWLLEAISLKGNLISQIKSNK